VGVNVKGETPRGLPPHARVYKRWEGRAQAQPPPPPPQPAHAALIAATPHIHCQRVGVGGRHHDAPRGHEVCVAAPESALSVGEHGHAARHSADVYVRVARGEGEGEGDGGCGAWRRENVVSGGPMGQHVRLWGTRPGEGIHPSTHNHIQATHKQHQPGNRNRSRYRSRHNSRGGRSGG
jgi:hypothetical protein